MTQRLKWHKTTKNTATAEWIAIRSYPTDKSGQVLKVFAGYGTHPDGGPRGFSELGKRRRFTTRRGLHERVRYINNIYGVEIPLPRFTFKKPEAALVSAPG